MLFYDKIYSELAKVQLSSIPSQCFAIRKWMLRFMIGFYCQSFMVVLPIWPLLHGQWELASCHSASVFFADHCPSSNHTLDTIERSTFNQASLVQKYRFRVCTSGRVKTKPSPSHFLRHRFCAANVVVSTTHNHTVNI